MGILAPASGWARIDGLDCFRDRVEVKRRVGYLPDEPVFYDYLRGSEIIRFSGEMHGLSRSEIDRGRRRWWNSWNSATRCRNLPPITPGG
jgi:ABC-2 type transport system ATP-binding protein